MLNLSENNKDLGSIALEEEVRFAVQVRNETDKPIVIKEVVSGCKSCTAASIIGNPVEVKIPSTLNVAFKPKSKGLNMKSVTLKYNNESLIFIFRAKVI